MTDTIKTQEVLFGANAPFIEELYKLYLEDSNKLDPEWRQYFASFPAPATMRDAALPTSTKIIGLSSEPSQTKSVSDAAISSSELMQAKLKILLERYRQFGHKLVLLDPLGIEQLPTAIELELDPANYGISSADDNIAVSNVDFAVPNGKCRELIDLIKSAYSSRIGIEFTHIYSLAEQEWIADFFESLMLTSPISDVQRLKILEVITEIETFEHYLHTKFPGAKRFSVEGGETAIAGIDFALEKIAAIEHIKDAVIGMAHRGRLATLTKVVGKPYHRVFAEFMGVASFASDLDIAGDVKYHMGYSHDRVLSAGAEVHVSLAANPSHLEAVNAIVAGQLRAKQDIRGVKDSALGILVHGDAAFCGQGIVAECFAMDSLAGYTTSGMIHFVINNQVGFTADATETRKGRYPTEFAKIGNCPILHVNGDDPEAVILATLFAIEYRYKFAKDCVIDVVCYRKYGHNEGDEPMYTQAAMYNIIRQKSSPGEIYAKHLMSKGILSDAAYSELKNKFKAKLDAEYELAKSYQPKPEPLGGRWSKMIIPDYKMMMKEPATGVAASKLRSLGQQLYNSQFGNIEINSKLKKLFEGRLASIQSGNEIEWGTGEALAFASLLAEGTNIRLSGQDVERGTFSHRHSVLHDQRTNATYIPLNNLQEQQGKYQAFNSFLSEYGVLGFEYGYASVSPDNLVIWEAQFGDFANGAQIIFDQFISAAETKWLRLNGMVVMLPHGYEGQGPEHSSARLERYLQLAAENNIQVAVPTTPASMFHLLRRQMHRNFRKPLIIMTPKSLLRHKLAVSDIAEFDAGTQFKPVLSEIDKLDNNKVTKLILCSGKVYYELLEQRRQNQFTNCAIIRLEQLYPFASEAIAQIIAIYQGLKKIVWCQEEPKNMGAWRFVEPYLSDLWQGQVLYAGRSDAASPAAGYAKKHISEQQEVINLAFSIGE